jgi:hypothetical protein
VFKLKYILAMHLVMLLLAVGVVWLKLSTNNLPFNLSVFAGISALYGLAGGAMCVMTSVISLLFALPINVIPKFKIEDLATYSLISVHLIALSLLFVKLHLTFNG